MEPLTEQARGVMGQIGRIPLLGYLVFFYPVVFVIGMLFGGKRTSVFEGANSSGFQMVKFKRLANHFRFSINDPRIDILLVFSCFLVAHGNWGYLNPRRYLTSEISEFDPQSWKGPKGLSGSR
jgi:hypothetical protein